MKKVRIIPLLASACMMLALGTSTAFASSSASVKEGPGVVYSNPETGVTVYRDAAGGTVLSNLSVPMTASARDQLDTLLTLEAQEEPAFTRAQEVDYEYNPIYIGTWDDGPCYARHTLGTYNSSLKYLASYGYASWYNTRGNAALPYRNGAYNNNSGQKVADVLKGSEFSIRDLDTDNSMTIEVTDWGPKQDKHPDRIADLDKSDFKELHGNATDGTLYCRTWVPIANYNP